MAGGFFVFKGLRKHCEADDMPMEVGPQKDGKRLILNVEVFRLGTHTNSEGKSREWTTDDLDSMIAAFKSGIPEGIPLKLGHTSDEFTGKVAEQLGLAPLTLTGDAEGKGQAALGETPHSQCRGVSPGHPHQL